MTPLTVARVADGPAFEALGPAWSALVAAARSPSVFQTWEWTRAWWSVYGTGKDLYVLAVRRDGELLGIVPLYRAAKGHGPFRVRELRFLGVGEDVKPDYLGILARPGDERLVLEALCRHLEAVDAEWDTARLTDLASGSETLGTLAERFRSRGCRVIRYPSATCRFVALPATYEAYLARLGKNQRYNVRRRTRALLEGHGARLCRWDEPSSTKDAVAALARLHRQRWAERQGSRSFASSRYLAFHETVARSFAERGWLRLYGLRVGEDVVAALYCYQHLGRVYYYQSGFDPRWYRYSTGLVLVAHALRSAIEEGAREFDFLRGDHQYKEAWADQVRTTEALYVAKPRLSARVDYVLSMAWPGVRGRVREMWKAASA